MAKITPVLEERTDPGSGFESMVPRTCLARGDLVVSVGIGVALAWMVQLLAPILDLPDWLLQAVPMTVFIAPLGAVAMVYFGVRLGQRWPCLAPASRFALVGLLNTLVDFSVLNLCLYLTGMTQGTLFALFKALSFAVAVGNSYLWNKHWSFAPASPKAFEIKVGGIARGQFSLFLVVTLAGLGLNAAVATLLVERMSPLPGFSLVQWANVAAGVGLAISTAWNFSLYRWVVFSHPNPSQVITGKRQRLVGKPSRNHVSSESGIVPTTIA